LKTRRLYRGATVCEARATHARDASAQRLHDRAVATRTFLPARTPSTDGAPLALRATAVAAMRLNVGCGPATISGWLNVDCTLVPGVDLVGDLREGLQLADASIDYIVAMHVLQDLPYLDVLPALRELRRVLKPGGVLRLGLPDLERAIAAWHRGDAGYFYIPDDEVRSLGGKLVAQAIWYGSVRTPFTWDFLEELSGKAAFTTVRRCAFGQTFSGWPDIVALDNRERESLYAEAVR
jgi:SAM-dependent methyltransferase